MLEKKSIERLEEDALAVGVAKIYSETSGIRKSFSVVKKMREDFGSFAKSIQFVSFEVCSSWSKEMKRCFLMFCEDFFAKSWLDSVENDQRHYLSLKPLMELSLYHKQALKNPLAFLTLGAGGRFGVLMIGSHRPLRATYFLDDPRYPTGEIFG